MTFFYYFFVGSDGNHVNLTTGNNNMWFIHSLVKIIDMRQSFLKKTQVEILGIFGKCPIICIFKHFFLLQTKSIFSPLLHVGPSYHLPFFPLSLFFVCTLITLRNSHHGNKKIGPCARGIKKRTTGAGDFRPFRVFSVFCVFDFFGLERLK